MNPFIGRMGASDRRPQRDGVHSLESVLDHPTLQPRMNGPDGWRLPEDPLYHLPGICEQL